MPFTAVAIGSVVAGAYAANKASKSADKATDAAREQAATTAEIGHRQMDLAEEQYADQKKLLDEYAPLFKQQIEQSIAEQAKSTQRGDAQWASYLRDFQPVEQRMARTALEFDTPQRREQAAGEAVGQVGLAFDTARAGMERSLADAGVKVGSGRQQAFDAQSRIEQAKASAGAANDARQRVEMQGLSLMDNAARFGRNMPSTGLATATLAGQQGRDAQGSVAGLSSLTAQPAATASSIYGQAAASSTAAGNLYLNAFQPQMAAARNNQEVFGDIAGAALKMYGFSSSEETKDVAGEVDGLAAADAVERSPAKHWRYKPGRGDGSTKERMGPTAESLASVAPAVSDGQQVDGIAMLGLHHAAIAGQNKRLRKVEKALGLADAKPRRAAAAQEV